MIQIKIPLHDRKFESNITFSIRASIGQKSEQSEIQMLKSEIFYINSFLHFDATLQ